MAGKVVCVFKFRCEKIDPNTQLGLSSKTTHLKGFAGRINEDLSPPEALLSRLQEFDVIAWDGDAISSQSFTKFIISMLVYCKDSIKTPQLLAHRLDISRSDHEINSAAYEVSEDALLASWDNKIVVYECLDDKHKLLMDTCNENIDQDDIIEKVIYYKVIPSIGPNFINSNNKVVQLNPYLDLAYQAMQDTKANNIISFGGGNGIKLEYYHYLDHIPDIVWFVWLLDRAPMDTNDEEREKCFFHQLQLMEGCIEPINTTKYTHRVELV